MRTSTVVFAAAAATGAVAQDAAQSLCDKYTAALTGENTAANQKAVLTQLVNTVVIGSYNMSVAPMKDVPGILKPAEVDGEMVNLAPYFDGSLKSSNRDGKATSVNFLDDGGAEPLMNNKAANGEDSNQYKLLNHLYQYFGALLQCSMMGNDDFPSYQGTDSMAAAHQFMGLSAAENNYFISQVGAAAISFGVSTEDAMAVGETLTKTFGFRCSAPQKITGDEPELQAICQDESCPIATESPVCDSYPNNGAAATPTPAPTGSDGDNDGDNDGSPTNSAAPSGTSAPPNSAAAYSVSAGVGIVAALAAVFSL